MNNLEVAKGGFVKDSCGKPLGLIIKKAGRHIFQANEGNFTSLMLRQITEMLDRMNGRVL